jgi:hypothetical protein
MAEGAEGKRWTCRGCGEVISPSYHLYQGPGHALGILAFGLLYGCAFAATRRLWPLVLCHAAIIVMA